MRTAGLVCDSIWAHSWDHSSLFVKTCKLWLMRTFKAVHENTLVYQAYSTAHPQSMYNIWIAKLYQPYLWSLYLGGFLSLASTLSVHQHNSDSILAVTACCVRNHQHWFHGVWPHSQEKLQLWCIQHSWWVWGCKSQHRHQGSSVFGARLRRQWHLEMSQTFLGHKAVQPLGAMIIRYEDRYHSGDWQSTKNWLF